MGGYGHLARRFFGSLRPGGPPDAERAWVEDVLSDAEYGLWTRMSGPDRRHSVQVAREVERRLGHEATPPVLAAALLHDVGKIDADLRTWGRVVATMSAKVAGPDLLQCFLHLFYYTTPGVYYVCQLRMNVLLHYQKPFFVLLSLHKPI